jgi:oligopeptide/dipeptide ABC transporter ATP-binding protein
MSDMTAVMYLGKLVEYGPTKEIFANPLHPYTIALFNAIPDIHMENISEIDVIEGNVPSAVNPPSGCRFHTRCPKAVERCRLEEPNLIDVGKDRTAACHLIK